MVPGCQTINNKRCLTPGFWFFYSRYQISTGPLLWGGGVGKQLTLTQTLDSFKKNGAKCANCPSHSAHLWAQGNENQSKNQMKRQPQLSHFKTSRAHFLAGCVRFDRGRSKNRDKHTTPDSKNTQRAAESTDGIEGHRTMTADTSSGSWLKTTLFKAFYQSPHLPPRLSPPNCCPFISPEWHHDLKLKWAIKPPLIPWQKTVSISLRPCAPVHRILILIIRMPLIMLPSFLLGSWLSECDLILHLFQGLPPSLDHPLLLFLPLFSSSLNSGFHFGLMFYPSAYRPTAAALLVFWLHNPK